MINEELMHYGVPGMRWGHRKTSFQSYGQMQRAKANMKAATRQSKADYNTAYSYTNKHPLSGYTKGRHNAEANKRWEQFYDSAKKESSAKQEYKNAKEKFKQDKINRTKQSVKDYNKKFDAANLAQEHADKSAKVMKEKYSALGKTRVTRMINSTKNTQAAKDYAKAWNKANRDQERADKATREMKIAYMKTGRNRLDAIRNNIKYGR